MRGLVPGLETPRPIGPTLPGLYQGDDLAQRWTQAFDEVAAPIHASLDNLAAYIDPWVAPDDFVEWLAGWVGAVVDETWDEHRRRAAVAQASDLYRSRGTAVGLAAQVQLVTGGNVEIVENGATAWSVDAGGALPGSPAPSLTVRIHVADPKSVDTTRLDRLVAAAKPAHVPHTIEVVKG